MSMTDHQPNDRDMRVRELYRMSKRQLAQVRQQAVGGVLVWSPVPPERWSKDELINEILQAEFPAPVSA